MYFTGDVIEVEKLHTSKTCKDKLRNKKTKSTPEKIKKHNEKLANDRLRRLVNCNFSENDLHVVLTYEKDKRPIPKDMIKYTKKFFTSLRGEYKKQGQELKYIYVSGIVDKDYNSDECENYKHKEVAPHHHIIINEIGYKIITKLWRYGRVMIYPLDGSGDYINLANYFLEHTKNNFRDIDSPIKKRWSCSRNLKKPKVTKEQVRSSSWREYPKAKEGYIIITDSVKYGVSEITGYPYQFYRMIRIKSKN